MATEFLRVGPRVACKLDPTPVDFNGTHAPNMRMLFRTGNGKLSQRSHVREQCNRFPNQITPSGPGDGESVLALVKANLETLPT